MDDLRPIEFDVQTGFDDGALRAQVDENLQRRRSISLFANGPSARSPKYDGPIPASGPIACVNGALQLFGLGTGGPDIWIACDPQPLVADFLFRHEKAALYAVASKCHAHVFESLDRRGGNVLVWHVDDASTAHLGCVPKIPTAVSVTICSLGLLYSLGYRDITVYGWDCCYLNGADHAVAQPHDRSKDIRVTVGDQVFDTTTTWACEVEDAINYLTLYPDLRISIPGPGMVGAIMRHKRVPNLELS